MRGHRRTPPETRQAARRIPAQARPARPRHGRPPRAPARTRRGPRPRVRCQARPAYDPAVRRANRFGAWSSRRHPPPAEHARRAVQQRTKRIDPGRGAAVGTHGVRVVHVPRREVVQHGVRHRARRLGRVGNLHQLAEARAVSRLQHVHRARRTRAFAETEQRDAAQVVHARVGVRREELVETGPALRQERAQRIARGRARNRAQETVALRGGRGKTEAAVRGTPGARAEARTRRPPRTR